MKSIALFCTFMIPSILYAQQVVDQNISKTAELQRYIELAQSKKLSEHISWQRLLYTDHKGQSEVAYTGYFLAENGRQNAQAELEADVAALFQTAEPNQAFRCRFPARSQWLMQELSIRSEQLPVVSCPEFDEWFGKIKPYKATLIYATDFMGNPSSMFGHTLLRLDPKDQKELNLVSYAINYAATVAGEDNWSYAWKGLTGQYPGEYSLMPYYRKVKEYGDFESRDLWEYELALTEQETSYLVKHIWEMQNVSFPYYFASDNCAYRLLGLMDLVRPTLNLTQKFKVASIPVETIKAINDEQLIQAAVYRPALETQLLSQAQQHGYRLAREAHKLAEIKTENMSTALSQFNEVEQAKILEMAYDHLYLLLIGRKVSAEETQPKLRQILALRSQSSQPKQRTEPKQPSLDPVNGHHARNFSATLGEVQGEKYIELGHRQAYHDLIDPQGGFRIGTQLMFWDGSIQYRDDQFKINHFDFLSVNSYNPITPFKTPLTWGFNFGWQQVSVNAGQFSETKQHGVAELKAQSGYSWANQERTHLCYVQSQMQVQGGKSLDDGWRVGLGPTLGCQNTWSEKFNSLVQAELPYWQDAHQWNLKLDAELQYIVNQQNALRLGYEYQQQDDQDWNKLKLSYVFFY
ncbi:MULTISPECIES: DUF4105 domain-containing protein [unclassified Acinetobacter]|uniref:Lnb N-terminal periplasmic domain-containing protein n=2 Tax=Acinetobacter TaxID=469 RepID=UPI0015D196C3|nr:MULTISPECIES: DUF4105 domain-containing protein [unclassified Acinetobacter]UUS58680.1 DUF4105 domain-containing protein [Acinetobacter sp. YH16040_T]